MEAFLFVVTIPTADYESFLLEALNKSINSQFEDKVNISIENELETSPNTPKASGSKINLPNSNDKRDLEKLDKNNIDFNYKNDNSAVNNVEDNKAEVKSENIKEMRKSPTKASLLSYMDEIINVDDSPNTSTPISKKTIEENDDLIYDGKVPLEKVLEQTLSSLGISAISWTSSTEGNHYHVSFGVQGGAHCEKVLHELRVCGVGSRADSTLSVLPCALHYSAPADKFKGCGKREEIKDSAWNAFVRSVRSRLTVAQLLEQIKAEAALTFDFFFLLIVAALTAALGLAENSTVFLVASMLISPLMGPIMAGTFGTAIQDRNLQKIGIIHELIGVFVTMCVGFVFGLIICGVDESYGTGEWPTSEILSRCDVRSLWVGALVALPSGAAVAISVLGGNVTSLVGVAISASLLPPAVNAGLLWAMSLVHLVFINDETRFTNVVKTKVYSDNPAVELAINGSVSLLLTVVNIVCIFVAGILVLMIKKVSPLSSSYDTDWQRDMRAARDLNKKFNHEHHENNRNGQETDTTEEDKDDFEAVLERAFAWEAFRVTQREIMEQLKDHTRKHMTWSPTVSVTKRPRVQDLCRAFRRLSETPTSRVSQTEMHTSKLQNYSRLQEDSPITTENSETQRVQKKNKRTSKFTVTPVNESNDAAK